MRDERVWGTGAAVVAERRLVLNGAADYFHCGIIKLGVAMGIRRPGVTMGITRPGMTKELIGQA